MGGLVFKNAYNLGAIDEKFSAMTDTIRGVVFLATPHQGRNLADVLRKFLAIVMQTPKQYINELRHNSEALVGINEQYVQHARNMHLASFRETQATSIRSIKSLIVDESSSKLNYPNEICWPLNANHHNVCKFASRQDQNYISVSSVIRDFVKLVTSKASCDWILDDLHFRGWLSDDSLEPSILKLSGSPGSGKSVMAGFLVTHLEEIQKNVQYFFFRYNEEAKRSIAVCLKMLAYQIALCMPEYRRKIFPLLEDKNALARNDARGVWQRAFVNLLAKMDLDEPLFWVIDAVDECESAQILLNLLPALKEQSIPVKIIFLTRRQASLRAFERLRYKFGSDFRQTEVVPTREGQKLFIEQELEGAYGEWPQNFVNNVKDDLLRKSKGVTDIALSPVGRRIYDLRQTYCHVWEPNSLMRMAEMDDADSDLADSRPGSTSFSLVSEEETVTAILDPIHCLAHSRHGTLYAYSNKVGMLSVVLDADATKIEDQGETIMGVSCIAWSEDGQIATADIGGNIVLRSVTEGRLVTSDLKLKSAEMVRQLLFDHSGRRLLARCITYIAWILHPFLHEALLSVTPRELTVHRWEDLESVQQWHIDFQAVESAHHDDVPRLVRSPSSTKALTRLELEASIDKVMFCKEGQWLFVQKSTASPDERRTLDLFTMDVAFLEPGQEGLASPVNSVSATPLPQQILREIEVPLGFVADHVGLKKTLGVPRNLDGASSMAFLGRDFWLCTWYLSADAGNVKIRKHFFLPRDWINMECLELAMITHDGRFLCPRNGELVVVSNGLGGGR
ncbi:Putative cytochrome b5 [Verticillium dahliae VDG2]|nr:Putative cytochrome b5 [Verticillium dahliae VDG2]